MKNLFLISSLLLFSVTSVAAATLSDALKTTFQNNLELQAERKNLEVQKEVLNISKSDFFPTLTLSGTKSFEDTNKLTNQDGTDASITNTNPMTSSIKLEQTLLDGSERGTKYEKSKLGLNLSEAQLIKKEQDVFMKAIEAYTGLILAYEKLNINEENVNLLQRQFEIDNARLSRAQITATDLAQSQSSLSGAQAGYIGAQNSIITSKLVYENIIGPINSNEKLKKIYNSEVPLPSSLVDAKKISEQKSPDLIIAEIEYGQSELDVKIARSDLSPTAKLSLERSYTDDLSATYDEREKDVLQATVSWPFQFGGKNKSNINKNLQVKGMKKLLLENAFRNNTQGVTVAWSTLESSKSLLRAVQSQVKAAEIANEGITFEYESGLNRSTFDVLQSRSNLINAKINLAEAERNYLLAQYRLLKSAGLLNSEYLKLR
ncbi:TolC family protein [Pelagibacterales bacterium SAG-MED16]|jgi:outer membrane protein|nr:TolC family protein [Pelagibacterales bacterium SAG-MED16]